MHKCHTILGQEMANVQRLLLKCIKVLPWKQNASENAITRKSEAQQNCYLRFFKNIFDLNQSITKTIDFSEKLPVKAQMLKWLKLSETRSIHYSAT